MYYAYAFFPVYFWRDILLRRETLIKAAQQGLGSSDGPLSIVLLVIGILAGLETLVSNDAALTIMHYSLNGLHYYRFTAISIAKLFLLHS